MPVNLPPADVATPARGGVPKSAPPHGQASDVERSGDTARTGPGRRGPGSWRRWIAGRRRPADIALVLLVAGGIAQLWRWSLGRPLWLDEQSIAINIRDRGFAALTGDLDLNQSAPLGWLWSERAVLELFGAGERALRLVPLMFGFATLVTAWLIGRRWLGTVGSVTLVGLCAASPPLLRYSGELKQYSADAFWVLALIGLAAWAVLHDRPRHAVAVWWGVAAVAGWFSMAAIIVTPASALVVTLALWRRHGFPEAVRGAVAGVVWLVSFGLHYLLSLRYTLGDPALMEYWRPIGFPRDDAGFTGTVAWIFTRPATLVHDPMELPAAVAIPLWTLATLGVVLAARRTPALGVLIAAPIAMSLALGAARLVPFSGRLVLWLVPVLFLAVAVAAQGLAVTLRAWWSGPDARTRLRALALSVLTGALAGWVLVAMAATGGKLARSPGFVDRIDDRAAVAEILREYRPGDIVLIAGPSKAAVTWYAGSDTPDHIRYFTVTTAGRHCPPRGLRTVVEPYKRVLAYVGHRTPDDPGTDEVIRARLLQIGQKLQTRRFGSTADGPALGVLHISDLSRAGYAHRPFAALQQVENCVLVLDR